MRPLIVAVALFAVACGASTTEPDSGECVPLPENLCDVFKNDIVRDSLKVYPDSLDPATGLPWDTVP